MRPSENTRLLLFGHELNGNLFALNELLAYGKRHVEWRVMVDNPDEYRRQRKLGNRHILSSQKLTHVWWAARASAIVSTHGPIFFRSWLRSRRRPQFIDVWHGVGFKASIAEAEPAMLLYDAHLVPSEAVAQQYKLAGASPIVTGYARTDLTIRALSDTSRQAEIRSRMGVNRGEPFVLFAPTWSGLGVDAGGGHLGSSHDVLEALSQAAEIFGFVIGYRGHINSTSQSPENLSKVLIMDRKVAPISELLLGIVDVLITDWSSIATDFMVSGRPIVYLDRPQPREDMAPLNENDRVGEVTSDKESLVSAVVQAIADPDQYQSRFSDARRATIAKAWGATLDGQSTERSLAAIENVIQKAKGPQTC